MPRRLTIIMLLLALTLPMVGQRQRREPPEIRQHRYFNRQCHSNFSVDLAGAASGLYVGTPLDWGTLPGPGGLLKANYTYFWNRTAGLHLGLGLTFSSSTFKEDDVQVSYIGQIWAFDQNPYNLTYRTSHITATIPSLRERFQAIFLEIPLQFAYQRQHFWMNVGGKILLPVSVSGKYDYSRASVGMGYDIDGFGTEVPLPVEFYAVEPQSGSYKVATLFKGSAGYPAYAAFSISGGYRYALNENEMLKFGLFIDFAINRTHVGSTDEIVASTNNDYHLNRALQSNIASSLRYFSVGLSATYNFTFGKRIVTLPSSQFDQHSFGGARRYR